MRCKIELLDLLYRESVTCTRVSVYVRELGGGLTTI